MQPEQLIRVDTFCIWHNVDYSFISKLGENGLIEITKKEDIDFIHESNLAQVEKLIRLHNELEINLEGVEVITYLLQKLERQQDDIRLLENKLRLYES